MEKTEFFDRLRSQIASDFSGPLLNKCKRWAVASIFFAIGVSCIFFGTYFAMDCGFSYALRVGFSLFWLALGVAVVASVAGIFAWLGSWEDPR